MPARDITISIDTTSRRIEYCVLEGIEINTDHFELEEGYWVARFPNFRIDSDQDLDLLVVVTGNPGSNSEMTVAINKKITGPYNLFKRFNRNGYGQFNEEIPV